MVVHHPSPCESATSLMMVDEIFCNIIIAVPPGL